ncbi:TPA: hypothetical protein F7062_14920 [Legionella pneumophila]|nr:hypothetical protein [Legionella pneumophila]
MTSLIEFKKQAKILRDFLGQKNHDITHSSCLEAIAIMNGFKGFCGRTDKKGDFKIEPINPCNFIANN